jgi:4-diphosphocytidyl-2-C-methyl-D-erythritol kinase
MRSITIFSPAKINRVLSIGNIQKNGLHNIATEIQKISLYDEIKIEWMRRKEYILPKNSFQFVQSDNRNKIYFSLINQNRFEVPNNELNIGIQAIKKFLKTISGITVHVSIKKNIPSKSGLGGGSSNAAHILLALKKIFTENTENIFHIGKELGSDVPFFLHEQNRCFCTGTGEIIFPLSNSISLWVVLIRKKRNNGISTKWAYEEWDKREKKNRCKNDFESIIFPKYPSIQRIYRKLQNKRAIDVCLCGSGDTIYGIFLEKKTAEYSFSQFSNKKYWKWIGKTLI